MLTYTDKNHTYKSLVLEEPKTERSRRVAPLAEEVVAALCEWQVRQARRARHSSRCL